MTRDEIGALLDRHQEAFARRDADALAAQHAEDGTFESPAHGVVHGRAKIADIYRYWFTAFPDLQLHLGPPIVGDDRVAVFWKFAGTAHGPFLRHRRRRHADRDVGGGGVRARRRRDPERQAHLRFLGCADEDRRVESEAGLNTRLRATGSGLRAPGCQGSGLRGSGLQLAEPICTIAHVMRGMDYDMRRPVLAVLLWLAAVGVAAAGPQAKTTAAFDEYVRLTESRLDAELAHPDRYLRIDTHRAGAAPGRTGGG